MSHPKLNASNYIHTIERFVDDYGWDIVIDELMTEAETAPQEELDEHEARIDAAIMLGAARGELFFSWGETKAVPAFSDAVQHDEIASGCLQSCLEQGLVFVRGV